eukprot:GFUD01015220.1.p1 GENE.GFUD01015220.1~~GFUD01015220.1.p1  ORF type:complete len:782 (-),score=165.86 GFUD01015220.1:101-2446(-)
MLWKYSFVLLFLVVAAQAQNESGRVKRQSCSCRAKAQCAPVVSSKSQTSRYSCDLARGKKGFCCQNVQAKNVQRRTTLFSTKQSVTSSARLPTGVSNRDIQNSLSKNRNPKRASGPEDVETQGHRLFTKGRREDQDLRDFARKLLHVAEDTGINTRQGSVDAVNSDVIKNDCPWLNERKPNCASNPTVDVYRTVDGSCNNRKQPLFGQSGTPMQRILEATYDERNLPRLAKSGSQLPSAREVSQTAFNVGSPKDSNDISVYFMQMGQFIDHDLTHSPAVETDCCLKNSQQRHWIYPNDPYNEKPDDCFPIEIPASDRFWGTKRRRCMEFTRSEITPPIPSCAAGRREQMSALTHWLDGGNIYGNTETEARNARDTSDRSRLKSSRSGRSLGRELLPSCSRDPARSNIEACGELCKENRRGCVFSGDLRVNEQPGLTVMHTVWVREHNRVAGELRDINRQWGNEKVFQEARRIVTAEWQHIIYNEWLPILLGFEYMTSFNLLPLTSGYSRDYDDGFDPRINNEFAAAAFRFGHSMIASHIPARDASGRNISNLDLKDAFDNPSFLKQNGFIDNNIRGYTQESAPAWDPAFVEDVVNHLFEAVSGQGGLDLTALNVQRGRDHGIPGYNNYRQICASARANFRAASDFNDLTRGGFLSFNDVRKLKSLYNHVDDIDLFIGGTLEDPHRDSILGPTFKCIIGDQFIRLKTGDRFWYENGDFSKSRFSENQLKEIRKSSMARILCDNTDITRIQPLVFKLAGGDNSFIQCNDGISIPRLNLEVFKA